MVISPQDIDFRDESLDSDAPTISWNGVDLENSMSVSFNTTSVATLDKLGKLYKTAIPLSDDPASEALVYSTSAITENKYIHICNL